MSEMSGSQLRFDAGLAADEPVHSLVQIVLVGAGEIEELSQAAGGGVEAEAASGGEFGGGLDDAGDDHGADEIPLAGRCGGDDPVQSEGSKRAEDSADVAVRERARDHKVRGGTRKRFALQDAAEGIDLRGRPIGEVSDGAFDDLAAFAG